MAQLGPLMSLIVVLPLIAFILFNVFAAVVYYAIVYRQRHYLLAGSSL